MNVPKNTRRTSKYQFVHYATSQFLPQKVYQVWRYFTTAFIHTDIIRLLQCISVEILIGLPLEEEYGSFRVVMIYFAGQLSGCLYTKIFDETLYEPDALPACYALISTQLKLLLVKWHSNFLLNARKWIVRVHVLAETIGLILAKLLYYHQISQCENIIKNFQEMNENEKTISEKHATILKQNYTPKIYTLKDFGIDDVDKLLNFIELYENSSHTLRMTGAMTGILLGLAIFDNKRNSSLKVKHLKIFLGFLYVILLGFSVMWISRLQDSGKTVGMYSEKFEKSDIDNNTLISFLQKDLLVSPEDASILAAILQLERQFGRDLKPSDILYIKLKTLGWIYHE